MHFGFNCLNHRVPPKIGIFLALIPNSKGQLFSPLTNLNLRSLSIKKAILYSKMLIFCPPKDHQAAPRQSGIFFFDSKPMQKAIFDQFRKSQECSGQVIG